MYLHNNQMKAPKVIIGWKISLTLMMKYSDHEWGSWKWSHMTNKNEPKILAWSDLRLLPEMKAMKKLLNTMQFWTKLRKKMGRTQSCSLNAHQRLLNSTDPAYKGSRWNVWVTWENGEVKYEPLSIMMSVTKHAYFYMQPMLIINKAISGFKSSPYIDGINPEWLYLTWV